MELLRYHRHQVERVNSKVNSLNSPNPKISVVIPVPNESVVIVGTSPEKGEQE